MSDFTDQFDDRLLRIPFTPSKPDLQTELQRLYDLEINVRLQADWDAKWIVAIGDDLNGWEDDDRCLTLDECAAWLATKGRV